MKLLLFLTIWYAVPTFWLGTMLYRTRLARRVEGRGLVDTLRYVYSIGREPWLWTLLVFATLWPASIPYTEYAMSRKEER